MRFVYLIPLLVLWSACGEDGRYEFFGPEDSVEKNRYMLAMEPVYAEGVDLTDRLRRSAVQWAQQTGNPDWETYQLEFKAITESIAAHQAKASDLTPEKADLKPVHARYLEGWSFCQNGVKIILSNIESRGREGSYIDAARLIDQGVALIRGFPASLVRQRIFRG